MCCAVCIGVFVFDSKLAGEMALHKWIWILTHLSYRNNPIEGHYLERTWNTMFQCIHSPICLKPGLMDKAPKSSLKDKCLLPNLNKIVYKT